MFEKLAADHPSDAGIKEGWAFSVMSYASTLSDPELRKKSRDGARSIALQAKQLGANDNLLHILLALPEDGSEPLFSDRKEVDEAMKAAEADFARGNRDGYLHVLMLDPNNYAAALFMGDVFFKQHVSGSAGEWFARAAQMNPDRETTYRYPLSHLGKSAEAREKYIQAIVAELYNQQSWMGLNQWAGALRSHSIGCGCRIGAKSVPRDNRPRSSFKHLRRKVTPQAGRGWPTAWYGPHGT